MYDMALGWPSVGKVTIKSLATGSIHYPQEVGQVEPLDSEGALAITRDANGLVVTLQKPNEYAYALRIKAKSAKA